MTSKEITQTEVGVPAGYQADLAYWLREIAYQLAVMNEQGGEYIKIPKPKIGPSVLKPRGQE
jgi:hypothetical protein